MDKEFGNQAILKVLRESGISYVVRYKNHGIFANIEPLSKAHTWVAKTDNQGLALMYYNSAICCFFGNAGSSKAVSGKRFWTLLSYSGKKRQRYTKRLFFSILISYCVLYYHTLC
jgi:hypothetical protein